MVGQCACVIGFGRGVNGVNNVVPGAITAGDHKRRHVVGFGPAPRRRSLTCRVSVQPAMAASMERCRSGEASSRGSNWLCHISATGIHVQPAAGKSAGLILLIARSPLAGSFFAFIAAALAWPLADQDSPPASGQGVSVSWALSAPTTSS